MRKIFVTVAMSIALLALVALAACSQPHGGPKVTVYKSPSCGCCVGYVGFLDTQGYDVETVTTVDMGNIKVRYGVPRSMESCHTLVVDDYFVEGHVPIEAVDKLLAEKPDIEGIAVPGMPSGSPGMPGSKRGPFEVYSIKDGETELWMTI